MKLTLWFPGHVKPVREGVYERRIGNNSVYSLWDGVWWRTCKNNPHEAACQASISWWPDAPWRGVEK